jgi:hypothetical protein
MYKRYYDIDVDAKAYANRIVKAGGRIPSDIGSVSDFIKGLKILNIWNSVEEIWLLRNQHNIGSGSTLYPVKNDLNYSVIGSNINWNLNGISFLATSEINMPNYKFKTSPFSLHVIDNTNFDGYTTNAIELGNLGGSRDRYFFFPGGNREYLGYRTDGQQFNLGSQITSNNFKSTLFSLRSSTSFEGYYGTTYRSGGTNANFNWDRDGTTNGIFRYRFTSGPNPNPTTSSIIIFNNNINDQYLNYYNLYKRTIGKGLGLA